MLCKAAHWSLIVRNCIVLSFLSFLAYSSYAVALLVSVFIFAKNSRKLCVSFSSIVAEQSRPSWRISLKFESLSISLSFFSRSIWTWNISRFFLIKSQRFSRFLGRSTGTLKPAASATLILSRMSGLMARAAGSISVPHNLRRHPWRAGLFFSQIFSFLFASRSRSFRALSLSLNVKISSSPGSLKGLVSYSKPIRDSVL